MIDIETEIAIVTMMLTGTVKVLATEIATVIVTVIVTVQ